LEFNLSMPSRAAHASPDFQFHVARRRSENLLTIVTDGELFSDTLFAS